ncbi:MAG: hypothetical protein CM1200mP36_10220 [Gammaproteobacteria bacterium]|nr:MAG: hypothetical protein CM1200mP36_10220 [Gammaproteobacteria bacterium]
MNTSEFLQEEIRQLPPRLEVERFNREVDRLREDADREYSGWTGFWGD